MDKNISARSLTCVTIYSMCGITPLSEIPCCSHWTGCWELEALLWLATNP